MDALRKAEQAKRGGRLEPTPSVEVDPSPPADGATKNGTSARSPDGSGSLPDLPPLLEAATAPATLPELPAKLEQLDNQFIAETSRRPAQVRAQSSTNAARTNAGAAQAPAAPPQFLKPPVASASDATNRVAAQNAFAAKQPLTAGNRTFAIVVGSITLLAIAAIGVYFWLQLKPSNGLSSPQPVAKPGPAATAPTVTPRPATAQAELPAGREPRPEIAARPRAGSASARDIEPRMPSGAAASADPIRITSSQLKVNPALADGFEAFQAGNLLTARTEYERVLQSDPRNADALRGGAAVALREGRAADAENYYLRLLEADPQDAVAQAGLVGLGRHNDPVAAESRLKTLLATQPEAPVLHFALGNLYARQSRWSEAQQAYFKAVTGDGDNPDYLFNLAVSLDQMHQSRVAAQYYRQALAAAATRPAGFDQGKVAARLRDLQP